MGETLRVRVRVGETLRVRVTLGVREMEGKGEPVGGKERVRVRVLDTLRVRDTVPVTVEVEERERERVALLQRETERDPVLERAGDGVRAAEVGTALRVFESREDPEANCDGVAAMLEIGGAEPPEGSPLKLTKGVTEADRDRVGETVLDRVKAALVALGDLDRVMLVDRDRVGETVLDRVKAALVALGDLDRVMLVDRDRVGETVPVLVWLNPVENRRRRTEKREKSMRQSDFARLSRAPASTK